MQSFISFSRCDLHTLRLILLINFITPFKTVPINYSFQFLRLELEGGGLYNKHFSAFALFHLIKLKGC